MGFTSLVGKHRLLLKSHSCAEFQPCRFHLNDPVKCVTTAGFFSAFEINDVCLYDSISLPQLLPGNNRKRTRKQNAISFLSQRFGCSKVYRLPSASPFSCVHFISGGCQSSGCFQNETTRQRGLKPKIVYQREDVSL